MKRVIEKCNDIAIKETRFNDLNKIWQDVQDKYEKYSGMLKAEKEQGEEESWIDEIEETYADVERCTIKIFMGTGVVDGEGVTVKAV